MRRQRPPSWLLGLATLLLAGVAEARPAFSVQTDGKARVHRCDDTTCNITVSWTGVDPAAFEHFQLCYREKSKATRGKDPCSFAHAYSERMHALAKLERGSVYKLKLKARRKSDQKTVTLIKRACIADVSPEPRLRCRNKKTKKKGRR